MAISKICPLYGRNKEHFIKTLKDRGDYGMNLDKTHQGRLITAYQCNPITHIKEFHATKQLYKALTGCSCET